MNGSDVVTDSDVMATTGPVPFYYFTIPALDIVIGIIYLFCGLFGIYSNG